jgi:hypothetical protein
MPQLGTPQAKATDSGSLSTNAPTCRFITALGLEMAVLKPRYTVNSSAAGSAKASAPM